MSASHRCIAHWLLRVHAPAIEPPDAGERTWTAGRPGRGAERPLFPFRLDGPDGPGRGGPPPHVFDRFYNAGASRTGVNGGSGLGLSIVKVIVERHDGRIPVTSRPGRTVFEMVPPEPALAG